VATDPDPRFSLANERTLLAWNRTGLAVIAGGIAVAQLLKGGPGGARVSVPLGIALIALGAALSVSSYRHWQNIERALRLGQPLPASPLPRVLIYAVVIVAIGAVVLSALMLTS